MFSQSCTGCKIHGESYEELARQSIADPNSQIQFNRMNNNKNYSPQLKSYPYTPVFMLFRKEVKDRPFVYQSQFCNLRLLKDFYQLSTEFALIPEEKFRLIYASCPCPDVQWQLAPV